MKSIWKGSISFGLVDIPVRLYSAIEHHAFGFTLLHATCHTPLSYHRWCSHCDTEVGWEDVVKGLPLKKGSYLVLTREKLKELKAVQTEQIKIISCIDNALIPPLSINTHYYLEPAQAANTAYFLFATVLKKQEKAALGQLVLKDREHMCAIQAHNNGLLLTTLNYSYEIKEQSLPKAPALQKKELALAEELINKITVKKFDIDDYKDTFVQKLKAHIKQAEKARTARKKVTATKTMAKTITVKKPTLMHKLQESVTAFAKTQRKPRARF